MPLIFYLSKKTRPMSEFVRGLSQKKKKKTKLNPRLLREKKRAKKIREKGKESERRHKKRLYAKTPTKARDLVHTLSLSKAAARSVSTECRRLRRRLRRLRRLDAARSRVPKKCR